MNAPAKNRQASPRKVSAKPMAIVGMACMFPKSPTLEDYWQTIITGRDCIEPVPETHWKIADYFNQDPHKPDHTYAKTGGFLDSMDFDPLAYGLPPATIEATDTAQILALVVAQQALLDAGYGPEKDYDRRRVSTILGVTGALELVIPLGARLSHPLWNQVLKDTGIPKPLRETILERLANSYVPWQEASFPGLLGNVVAGRIANRLDLGGTNCVVDAACASSLSAIHLASMELETGRSDMVVTGGIDTFNDIFMYMCFSKTPALSKTGHARPFDANGDGTILGEGVGVVVLRRLDDAARDGDRIYAVLKSVGSSSDGKGQAIYAPSSEGQARALTSAYRAAAIEPQTIELLEAHGTGTKVGDEIELQALTEIYQPSPEAQRATPNKQRWCALGSVKSQIGHTKAAAGIAGLIKAALALHNKALPPSIKVKTPLPDLQSKASPFYLNAQARPWIPSHEKTPRRAGLSSFGFGGSNFHCVLEEFEAQKTCVNWSTESLFFAFSAPHKTDLLAKLEAFQQTTAKAKPAALRAFASQSRQDFRPGEHCRLLIPGTASDWPELLEKGKNFLNSVRKPFCVSPSGFAYGEGPAAGQVAAVFPGQGAQYCGMLAAMTCAFPESLHVLNAAETVFRTQQQQALTDLIYPKDSFVDQAGKTAQQQQLTATNVAQLAIGAVSYGAFQAMQRFAIPFSAFAGHSYGELTALLAARRLSDEEFYQLSSLRGQLMAQGQGDRGSMLAVKAKRSDIERILEKHSLDLGLNLIIANHNSPTQVVLSGASRDILNAQAKLKGLGFACQILDVSAAFHSKFVEAAAQPFAEFLQTLKFQPGQTVYANTSARAYPEEPAKAKAILAAQLTKPVEFVAQIQSMYNAGIRCFVEIGPGQRLTNLIKTILVKNDDLIAVSVDSSGGQRHGLEDLARCLATVAAAGYPCQLNAYDPRPEPPAKPKRRFTVKLNGANYRSPGHKAKNPIKRAGADPIKRAGADPIKRAGASARPNAKAAVLPKRPQLQNPAIGPRGQSIVSKPEQSESQSTLANEALRITQENIAALQQLQQQNAALHQQFLMGQQQAQQTFHMLLQQQQQVLFGRAITSGSPMQTTLAPPQALIKPSLNGHEAQQSLEPAPLNGAPKAQAQPGPSRMPAAQAPTPAKNTAQARQANASKTNKTSQPSPKSDSLAPLLLEIVAEKTGYPKEMLELTMSLDTDLGIDSIKRVEILSALQEKRPELPTVQPEQIGQIQTLQDIAELLSQHQARSAPPDSSAEPPPTKKSSLAPLLLEIVAEKTGYPKEMLELTMSLDTDLGIDSIKRVEILSALQEKRPELPTVQPEQIGQIQTLQDIAELLSPSRTVKTGGNPGPFSQAEARANLSQIALVERYLVSAQDFSEDSSQDHHPRSRLQLPVRGEVFVAGFAENDCAQLASAFETLGLTAKKLNLNKPIAELPELKERPDEVFRTSKAASGLVLIAPRQFESIEQLECLIPLAQHFYSRLGPQTGFFVTVSRLDGEFCLGGEPRENINALSGALAGLSKTASHEWPNVHCRALDVPATALGEQLAQTIAQEALSQQGPIELGIQQNLTRRVPVLRQAPIPWSAEINAPSSEVFLVTGGAKGITAACLKRLAQQARDSVFVIVGRSQAPTTEQLKLAGDWRGQELQQAVMRAYPDLRSPRDIRQKVRDASSARDIQTTLEMIRATGAIADYRSLDVQSTAEVQALVADVVQKYGQVTGFIHGAGVLADRLIVDKTPAQFRRVFATKVNATVAFFEALKFQKLRYIALFSSSTARFGRSGQVDYGMANEALNKLARREQQRRPECRVVSINWGPWQGGMVDESLEKLFVNQGIQLIPQASGAELLLQELFGNHHANAVEVVCLGEGSDLVKAAGKTDAEKPANKDPKPFVPAESLTAKTPNPAFDFAGQDFAGQVVFSRRLAVGDHPCLRDHVIGNRAVLPMALSVEWFAHAATQSQAGLRFVGMEGLHILRGVTLSSDEVVELKFVETAVKHDSGETLVELEMQSESRGQTRLHARAQVRLASAFKAAGATRIDSAGAAQGEVAQPAEALYRELLFHGPSFQAIETLKTIGAHGLVASSRSAPAPAEWLAQPTRNRWLADPLILDSAFQLMIVWTDHHYGKPSLPTRFASYRQYRKAFPKSGAEIRISLLGHKQHKAEADIEFVDDSGQLIAEIRSLECVIDESLRTALTQRTLP